jgi:hypothetical protein
MQLPATIDPDDFDARYRTAPGLWRAAVDEVCAAHALACDEVHAFADGSNLVASVAYSRSRSCIAAPTSTSRSHSSIGASEPGRSMRLQA